MQNGRHLHSPRAFTIYMKNSLLFEISLRSNEIWNLHCSEVLNWTEVIFPEVIWSLIMKMPYTKMKLYPKVKSQTDFK